MARCNLERLAQAGLLALRGPSNGLGFTAFPAGLVAATGVPVPRLSAYPTCASRRERTFSSRAAQQFDMLTLPSRKGIFSDAVLVSNLLPNRKEFTPQFSPHGLTLIPKSMLVTDKTAQAAANLAAAAARLQAARAQLSGMPASPATMAAAAAMHAAESALPPDAMQAAGKDRTLVWRKLKMKKHKIKKRRKLNRYKND